MDSLPAGYELLEVLGIEDDVNEKVQAGDIYWDDEDWEWLPVPRSRVGSYLRYFTPGGVARKLTAEVNSKPVTPVTVKRLKRSRRR